MNICMLELFKLRMCCTGSESHKNYPIVLEIMDLDLRILYGGQYLLQIWSDSGEIQYEKVLKCKIF